MHHTIARTGRSSTQTARLALLFLPFHLAPEPAVGPRPAVFPSNAVYAALQEARSLRRVVCIGHALFIVLAGLDARLLQGFNLVLGRREADPAVRRQVVASDNVAAADDARPMPWDSVLLRQQKIARRELMVRAEEREGGR